MCSALHPTAPSLLKPARPAGDYERPVPPRLTASWGLCASALRLSLRALTVGQSRFQCSTTCPGMIRNNSARCKVSSTGTTDRNSCDWYGSGYFESFSAPHGMVRSTRPRMAGGNPAVDVAHLAAQAMDSFNKALPRRVIFCCYDDGATLAGRSH